MPFLFIFLAVIGLIIGYILSQLLGINGWVAFIAAVIVMVALFFFIGAAPTPLVVITFVVIGGVVSLLWATMNLRLGFAGAAAFTCVATGIFAFCGWFFSEEVKSL